MFAKIEIVLATLVFLVSCSNDCRLSNHVKWAIKSKKFDTASGLLRKEIIPDEKLAMTLIESDEVGDMRKLKDISSRVKFAA